MGEFCLGKKEYAMKRILYIRHMKKMNLIGALFVTLIVTTSYAAEPAQSVPAQAGGLNIGGYQVSAEEVMLLVTLLQTPMFKGTFVQTCSDESKTWLGQTQADATCDCAYERLVKDNTLISKVMAAGDGQMADFNQWGFDLIEPCLPKEFPVEIENFFIKECMKPGDMDKATCDCVVDRFKSSYTVRGLVKTALQQPKYLQTDMLLKSVQCLAR